METATHGIGGIRSSFPNLGVNTYQRALVWGGEQKAAYIRSLLRDFPTGIIVLNKFEEKPGFASAEGMGMSASHDIIDGQQRLTTLYQFLESPLSYIIDWSKPNELDPPIVDEMRGHFDALYDELKLVKSGYAPSSMKARDVRAKMVADAHEELRRSIDGKPLADPRFKSLVDSLAKFYLAVTRKKIVVQELTNISTADAEQIYKLINTAGTEMMWWELLKTDPFYAHHSYSAHPSTGGYSTQYDGLVDKLCKLERRTSKLKAKEADRGSFWAALFALGEYFHFVLSHVDPQAAQDLLPRKDRKLKVDGLGFRLTTAILSHEVSRVGINQLGVNYREEDIRRAIDVLFTTGALLTANKAHFSLLHKYSKFGMGVVPAYPVLAVIVAAGKMVGANVAAGKGKTLTENDWLNLRSLTESIFREAICTDKWSGSGDSKLKGWLDDHFEGVARLGPPAPGQASAAPFPGKLRTATSDYNEDEWKGLIASLEPTGQRSVDKRSMYLWFWIQYLYDSQAKGSLPLGGVAYDHLVPYQDTPGSGTTHPLNFAAINTDLNGKKGKQSVASWAPVGNDRTDYEHFTMEAVQVLGQPPARFLHLADHARIAQMLEKRRPVLDVALLTILPHWISNGDA